MNGNNYPRIIISGLSGDSGKTIVSCGLTALLKKRGFIISCFKKGPDYIDAAWLTAASGKPARNLDSFMMGFPVIMESFLKYGDENGFNIIEGNRGLFDGVDAEGTHSTAELARLLQSPVIIIQDISKVTRTAAASILGCLNMDPQIQIAGVILNKAAGDRHINIVREAIERETGISILGAIPKLSDKLMLPSRHLGLIMPDEIDHKTNILEELGNIIEENVDVSKVIDIIKSVPALVHKSHLEKSNLSDLVQTREKISIGYFKDNSFSFYYPENLEILEEAGVELIALSSINSSESQIIENLEKLDALYIGGGFPEINLPDLAANNKLFFALRSEVEKGLPVYTECGGLMYLADKVIWKEKEFTLAGILPIKIQMYDKPQGHGYVEAIVDGKNPFFKQGTIIKGHEFHYSRITEYPNTIKSTLSLVRGRGSIDSRDGLVYKNVFASYIHIHALASPEWAEGMIECAKNYKRKKQIKGCREDRSNGISKRIK